MKEEEKSEWKKGETDEVMILFTGDDKPVSNTVITGRIFLLSERDLMNVLTPGFHCHTCFYSEDPNVPLRVMSFLF